jgi:hypothetical protein
MILHDGYQAWEICWSYQLRTDEKTLPFGSKSDALSWLQALRSYRPELILWTRSLLAERPPIHGFRLRDYATLDELARLLYAGSVVAISREKPRQPSIVPASKKEDFVPFPLSARKGPAPSTYRPPPSDPPTFSSNADLAAQAAALVAAAHDGKPFCPE